MSTNTTNQPFNWKVAAIGVALGVALGAGGTVLITFGGESGPGQSAACAQVAQLQKKVNSGPMLSENYSSQTTYVSGSSQALYNAAVSQLASQTALCHGG